MLKKYYINNRFAAGVNDQYKTPPIPIPSNHVQRPRFVMFYWNSNIACDDLDSHG